MFGSHEGSQPLLLTTTKNTTLDDVDDDDDDDTLFVWLYYNLKVRDSMKTPPTCAATNRHRIIEYCSQIILQDYRLRHN